MNEPDKKLRENLMRDLDILHTVNHKKGERPDLYAEMNLIDKYVEAYGDERERLGRIDELEHIDDDSTLINGRQQPITVRYRIAELQKGIK